MEQPQVSKQETDIIIRLANKILSEHVEGDLVEFGCYRGDTSVLLAKLIKDQKSDKKLWLYDSFAGLPEKTQEDSSSAGAQFKKGELLVSKHEVAQRFRKSNLPNPIIKKAFFSELNPENDLPEYISFAFLDGDLYASIKTSLALVVPKMKNGIIIIHDYNNPELPGVTRAVDEFLAHNPRHNLKNQLSLAILTC